MQRKFKVVGARFSESDAKLLMRVCTARDENVSNFVRRSVRKELARLSFLSEYYGKELGGILNELEPFEEMVGELKKIKRENDGFLILYFENSHVTEDAFHHNPKFENMKFEVMNSEIVVPPHTEFEEEITKFVGKKIGLLYAGNHYVIREIRNGECAEIEED